MFCPKCGANLVDGAEFCQKCGVQLKKKEQPAVQQPVYSQPAVAPAAVPAKSGRKTIIIISVVCVIIIAALLAAIIGLTAARNPKQKQNADDLPPYEDTYGGEGQTEPVGYDWEAAGRADALEMPEISKTSNEIYVDGVPLSELLGMPYEDVRERLGDEWKYSDFGFKYRYDQDDWIDYHSNDGVITGVNGTANHFAFGGEWLDKNLSELNPILGGDFVPGRAASNDPIYAWTLDNGRIAFSYHLGEDKPYEVGIKGDNDRKYDLGIQYYVLGYKDIAIEELIGEDMTFIDGLWGVPPSHSYGYGVNFYDYGDAVVYYDAFYEITSIELRPQVCTLGNQSLAITGEEFRKFFGEPDETGTAETYFAQSFDENGDYYYMTYNNICKNQAFETDCSITVYLDSRDGDVEWIVIYQAL